MKNTAVISGTGLYVPDPIINNQELVTAYNQYAEKYNQKFSDDIKNKKIKALIPYNDGSDIIEKVSGIKIRHVIDKTGILDCERMRPLIPTRADHEQSLQCEFSVKAAQKALIDANQSASNVDGIIIACSNFQRAYPTIATEVQYFLGINGFAYDMNIGCSSSVFAIHLAKNLIVNDDAKSILIVSPEIFTPHINFKNRNGHYIFGDGCAAVLVENINVSRSNHPFKICNSRLKTQYSSNIRNNFGYLGICEEIQRPEDDLLFYQKGSHVINEVVQLASSFICEHLHDLKINMHHIKRFWLHQANLYMNQSILKNIFNGRTPEDVAPMILNQYANVGAASVIMAFHHYNQDLNENDYGLFSAFGGGYSVGNILVQKI